MMLQNANPFTNYRCEKELYILYILLYIHIYIYIHIRLPFFYKQKVLLNLEQNCSTQCYCFLALVDVIELILASARVTVSPQRLLAAVEKFLELFKDAWGLEWMIPKFHWLLHFHKMLERLGFLLNCFCLERKHRGPKRYANEITNISSGTSQSLLMEVTSHHLGQLSNPDAFSFDVGLVGGRRAPLKTKQVLTAELQLGADAADSLKYAVESRFSPVATCHKGDVVILRDPSGALVAGKVQLHCSVLGLPLSLINSYTVHKREPCGYSIWTPSEENHFIETHEILETVVFSELPNGKVAILLPLEFR